MTNKTTILLLTLLTVVSCFGQTNEFKSLDQALLNIEKCVKLDLYGQNLKVISTDITKLINLRELNIGGNPELDLKTTFKLLATIKSLQYLSIEDNKLKNIPREIYLLKNLKEIDASGNKLKKIPNEICKLSELETLHIYSNSIKKLPENLHHLKNLKYLNCNGNNIQRLSDSISSSNIQTLKLGANKKIDIEQILSAFFFCKFLDTLVLYNCNIRTIPTIIYHQRNLKYLDLSGNPFSTIPIELGQLTNLKTLRISDLIYGKYDKELHRLLPETTIIR